MIKPINDYVLVEIPQSNLSRPDDNMPQRVKVLDVEDINLTNELQGKYVIVQKYALADGTFEMDGKKVGLIKNTEIMGVENA